MSDRVDEVLAAWRTELPEALVAESELVKRILLTNAALAEATRIVVRDLGLTGAEFDILVSLRRTGAPYRSKPNDLTRLLLLSSGGTSNVVNHLLARGLVAREPDPDDGRSTWVRLTDAGIALAEQAVLANTAAHAALFADADPALVRAATEALRALGPALTPAVSARRRRPQPAPANRARPAV